MRRGNKSHKVPNVKLRPAPFQPRSAREPDAPCDRSSDSEAPPTSSMADLCPRPFKGFTICATGMMDKPALFKMAFELGATSTSDFTDRVTHLVASAHGGAKYLCALERKIPIMTPEWVANAHAVWLRGDDVDVDLSVFEHRLPIFSGVALSLSGIEDVNRRTEINRLVTLHQGTYLKNLERPVRVTHLLCSGDTETDKMKYAEKFNKRKEAHIHLLWEEWFWDCLEFGGRFDERKYQVSRPRPERKSPHEIPVSPFPVQDSATGSRPNSAIPTDSLDKPKRSKPVVPTGSFSVINNLAIDDDDEEMAIVNKPVHAVTLQLWQCLLKPRGFEIDRGKLVRSPSKSQAARSSPATQTSVAHRNEPGKQSVISSVRRANSFAPVAQKDLPVRQPFRRNTTLPAVCSNEAQGSGLRDQVQPEGESAMLTLFAGYTFRLLGEARCSNVRVAIERGGGVVTDDDAEEPCFIIVRLISGSKLYHDEFDDYARTKYRTECWLEHSVFHERICDPNENVSFTPLKIAMPVPGAEKIRLSLSGLDQSELCWIRRLGRAVGVTLEPTFSRRSTHLVCPSGTGVKFDKGLEWRIPVVSLAWLEDIARTGTVPLVDEYLVGGSRAGAATAVVDEADGFGHARLLVPVPEVKKDKGKGKAKEMDYETIDITHDDDPPDRPMFVKNARLLHDPPPPRDHVSDLRRRHDTMPGSRSRSPAQGGLFGKPRFLTHDSDPPEEDVDVDKRPPTSSPPAPPPPSSSPPLPEPTPLPPLHAPLGPADARRLVRVTTDTRTQIDLQPQLQAQAQVPSQAQSLVPTQTPTKPRPRPNVPGPAAARIPSSTSPSPMKLPPSSSLPDAFASSSPARLPDTDAITKALHESLTSLLGKRPIAEDREEGAGGGAGGAGRGRGKRVRPGGPSNIPSRNASHENVISPLPFRPPIAAPPVQGPPPAAAGTDLDTSLLEGLGMMRSTEDSMQVTYEDPAQAEEKRRLLRMLGGDEVGAGGGIGGGVGGRRTKRLKVSGF